MPSSRRCLFQRWGLGIVASFVMFMTVPALGWALFNSGSTNTASITASTDWTAPSVSVTDPGTAIRATATIAATATDGETGVKNVAVAWAPTGTTTWTTLCTDTTNPY